jgi:iron complex outermembrane recepter protein
MKRILVICLMILNYQIIDAQNIITGKITDKATGDVIPGATIYFPELKTGDISDKDGTYKIPNLPKTKTIVQVSFLGYKSIVENVDLSTNTSLNFELEEAITEINEVVITGNSRTTELTRSPVPIITLNNRELRQTLNTNIIDAIAKLPGVSAVTTGPNVSKPFIHGLGYNRVLTLFDGVRVEGQQWGDEHGIEVDENAVDNIEIVKGPASLIYGSDALAGVVNFLPASAFHNDTIQGRIETDYQTNNGQINLTAALNANSNGFIWGGVLSHKQAKNYQNRYDGRVYGTAFNETDLRAFIGLNKQWGYSHLNFSIFNDLQEIPDGSRDSLTREFTKQITEADTFRPIVTDSELNSYKIALLHQHVQHYLLYSSNNFIIGKSKLGLTLGYQQSIRREFSHPQSPDIPGLYLDLKTITYDIKYILPESGGWETTAGINGMYQSNSNKGTEFIIPDYRQLDIGPFVLVTKTIDKLSLSAGLRYDIRIFKNDPMYTRRNPETGFDEQVNLPDTAMAVQTFYEFSHVFSGLSANLGATYNFTRKFLIKANIARGFRAPNIAEISANGVHPGTLIYQIGNKAFKPEFSLQEDLGISYRSDHLSGDIEIFNNNISNYIFNQKLLNHLGQDSVIIEGNQTFEYQQSKAQLYGWEVNLDIHPYDWLHFENSISAIYGLNRGGNGVNVTSSSRYLPSIPPVHSNTELRANIKNKSTHFSSLYFKIGVEYYAKQERIYSADNTETPTPAYALYNAGIGVDITKRNGKVLLNINVLGNNITDVAYQSHMSRLKYFEEYPNNPSGRSGIYNMGRNVSFKLTLPLNFK